MLTGELSADDLDTVNAVKARVRGEGENKSLPSAWRKFKDLDTPKALEFLQLVLKKMMPALFANADDWPSHTVLLTFLKNLLFEKDESLLPQIWYPQINTYGYLGNALADQWIVIGKPFGTLDFNDKDLTKAKIYFIEPSAPKVDISKFENK